MKPRNSFAGRNARIAKPLRIAVAFTILTPTAFAQIWTGGAGAPFDWSNAANWSVAPVDGNSITFDGSTGTTNNNDGALATVNTITFAAGATPFTLGGSALTVTDITNSSASQQTISLPVTVNAAGGNDLNLNGQTVVFNGAVTWNNAFWLNSAGTAVFNAAGTGSGRAGVGVFALNTGNATGLNYTISRVNAGNTVLELGNGTGLGTGAVQCNQYTYLRSNTSLTGASAVPNTFVLGNNTMNISGSNNIELAGGGQFLKNGSGDTAVPASAVINAGNNRTLDISNTGTTTISGPVAVSDNAATGRTLTLNVPDTAGTTTISGTIQNFPIPASGAAGGFTKSGNGTLILSGTNTYTGTTFVSAGILTLKSATTLSDTSVVNIATSGATLNLDFAGTEVVTDLKINNVSQGVGIFGAVGSGAPTELAQLSGTGLVQVLPTAPADAWDGGGADNNWSTAANWKNDTAPVAGTGKVMTFAGNVRTTPNNDLAAGSDFSQIAFFNDAAPFNLTGNAVRLNAGTIITNGSANDQVVSMPIDVPDNTDHTINAGGKKISLNGGVDYTDATLAPTGTAGTIAFNAAGTGSGRNPNGNMWALNDASSNGLLRVMRNDLANVVFEMGHHQGLGMGAIQANATITLQAGASLAGAIPNTFVLGNGNLTIAGSNNIELSGNGQNFRFNDPQDDPDLGVIDTGIPGGAIIAASNASFYRDLNINNTGSTTISGDVYLEDGGSGDSGIYLNVAGTAGPFVISGTVKGSAQAGSQHGRFTKAGTGSVTLAGNNTFESDFRIIGNGTVKIGHANALGAVERLQTNVTNFFTTADITLGSDIVEVDFVDGVVVGQTVTGTGIPAGTTVTAVGTDLNGNNLYPVTLSQAATETAVLVNLTFSSSTTETVIAGTLVGDSSSNSGTLDLNGFTIAEPIYKLEGAGSGGVGTLINTNTGTPAAITANLNGVYNCTIGGPGDITVPRLIATGNRVITKIGAGTFTTSGSDHNNNIGWAVNEGTVVLANTAGRGADRDVSINGGTLRLQGANTNLINDTANVTIGSVGVVNIANGATEAVNTLIIDGVQQTAGTYGATGSGATHIDNTHFAGTGVLNVLNGPTGGDDYASWATANGATGQPSDQDHDLDGVENGVEYFMGETGVTFTANPPVVVNGSTRTVTWPKSPTFSGTYQVQTSPGLVTWTDVTGSVVDNGTSVIYTFPAPSGKLFVRLVVTPN